MTLRCFWRAPITRTRSNPRPAFPPELPPRAPSALDTHPTPSTSPAQLYPLTTGKSAAFSKGDGHQSHSPGNMYARRWHSSSQVQLLDHHSAARTQNLPLPPSNPLIPPIHQQAALEDYPPEQGPRLLSSPPPPPRPACELLAGSGPHPSCSLPAPQCTADNRHPISSG